MVSLRTSVRLATLRSNPRQVRTCALDHSLKWINEPTKVFIARRGVHELTTTILTAD